MATKSQRNIEKKSRGGLRPHGFGQFVHSLWLNVFLKEHFIALIVHDSIRITN